MTTEPTRYDWTNIGMCNLSTNSGKYVTYTDFAALKAERDALRNVLTDIKIHAHDATKAEITHLVALYDIHDWAAKALTTPGPAP